MFQGLKKFERDFCLKILPFKFQVTVFVTGQTRQEACDRLETTVMRPSGTREKQTNKQTNLLLFLYNF
jgi:hypothetical protein